MPRQLGRGGQWRGHRARKRIRSRNGGRGDGSGRIWPTMGSPDDHPRASTGSCGPPLTRDGKKAGSTDSVTEWYSQVVLNIYRFGIDPTNLRFVGSIPNREVCASRYCAVAGVPAGPRGRSPSAATEGGRPTIRCHLRASGPSFRVAWMHMCISICETAALIVLVQRNMRYLVWPLVPVFLQDLYNRRTGRRASSSSLSETVLTESHPHPYSP